MNIVGNRAGGPLYRCDDGGEVSISQLCDGNVDCPLEDDETNLLCAGIDLIL